MDVLLLCTRVLLAAIFTLAGVTKALDRAGSRKALADFGLAEQLVIPAALVLPIVELAIAILLLLTRLAYLGASAALGLLILFAIIISISLLKGNTPDCHCFGQIHSGPISWALVVRNGVLAILAASILWRGAGMSIVPLVRRVTEVALAQPLPWVAAGLAVGGLIVQLFLLVALFQQNGRLMLRIENLERGAASFTPPPPAAAGLPIGCQAPSFEFSSENGRVSLETLLIRGRPIVLVFTEPNCGPCLELLPEVARWEGQFTEEVTFVIISRASEPGNGRRNTNYAFQNIAWQENREISESYKVYGTPAAVVVRPDGRIGSFLASGRPAIQALFMFLLYMRTLDRAEDLVS
jgi:thiol-disulfide isomerase/thioredoxin